MTKKHQILISENDNEIALSILDSLYDLLINELIKNENKIDHINRVFITITIGFVENQKRVLERIQSKIQKNHLVQ